jgi:RHS repeat-associated protein
MVAGSAVRTVSRTFNRFHLLTSEATIRGNCLQTVETTYYADDGLSFEQQVRQCQLPRQVYTRWELDDDPREWREDKEISEYDIHGNQTLSVQANGITETTRYFPAEEVPGECPADPYGFVRHMREKTVTPASAPALVPDLQGGAPTLRTRYRYVEQPAISSSTTPWVALIEERLLEVNAQTEGLLERSAYSYFDEPSNHLLHGQRKRQAVTLGEAPGYTTFTDFEYSKPSATYATFAGEAVLLTKQILSTDFDSVGKEINEERSLLNGEPLLTSDKDVKIRYSYDALGRVLTETVAPDSSQHAATRTYSYGLIRPAGQGESPGTEQASQVVENVKGVKTRTWFDGLNRAIREERQDIDNAGENPVVFRAIYEASYDALGQLSSETEIDWLETIDMRQTSTYSYDLWGQQASVIGPDGVKSYTHSNPITFVNEEWTEGMGKTVTLTNRLEKPVTVERFDLDGETRISLHSYKYDGLGRTTYEKNAANHETMYAYDVYDRMLETTLPDRSKVQRQYAVHSRGDLPTLISVNDIVLGTQAFDGLERMIESITGGRKSTYLFDTNQSQPDRVIRPNGDLIAYEYTPELTEEPIKRTAIPKTAALATIEATYAYDPHNARLLESSEQGLALTRTYDSTGEVIGEKRDHDGVPYEMAYVYSRTGRLIRYTDVLGQAQRYHYDESTGRLEWTALGEEGQPGYIRTAFDYNAQGQTVGIETEDGASGQSVKIALEYDALGRETVRVFDFGETASRLSQTWNSLDQVERRLMSEGADAGGATLRDERYSYELRGRLEEYTCEGSQSPVDPYGKTIARQLFFFDALDNHEEVRTWFAGGSNTARFVYDEEDPAQLRRVINTHEDYPSVVELNYDANGNLLQDEEGRTLAYDGLGRLESVSEVNGGLPKAYRYDSEDTLSTVSSSSNDEQRFYRGDDLANRIDGEQQSTFMRGDGVVLAERQAGAGPKSLLLASDHNNSVLSEVNNGAANSVAYSAYGYPSAEQPVNTRLGYNGEFSEPLTGWQLLGNGYRAFNSTLMRFHSPDSWSPFGDGGVNAYAYCMGNPIMFTDPSGHRLLGGIIRFFGGATKNNKLARAAAQSWIDELKVNKLPDFVNVKKHQGPSIADIEKTYGAEVAQYYKYTDEVADRGIQYVKNVTRIENIASGRTYSKPSEVNLVIATTSKLKQEAVTRLNAQSELLRPTVPMRSGPKGPDFELAKIRKSGESSRKVRFDDHVKKMTY